MCLKKGTNAHHCGRHWWYQLFELTLFSEIKCLQNHQLFCMHVLAVISIMAQTYLIFYHGSHSRPFFYFGVGVGWPCAACVKKG